MDLDVKWAENDRRLDVRLGGDLDATSSKELKRSLESEIEQTHPDEVVVDCSGLNYIDSTGLGVLVSAMKMVREHGGRIKIVRLKPYLQKIFRVTGLTGIFEIEEIQNG